MKYYVLLFIAGLVFTGQAFAWEYTIKIDPTISIGEDKAIELLAYELGYPDFIFVPNPELPFPKLNPKAIPNPQSYKDFIKKYTENLIAGSINKAIEKKRKFEIDAWRKGIKIDRSKITTKEVKTEVIE